MPTAEQLLNIPPEHPARSKKVPWYKPSLGNKLTEKARALFQEYSGISPGEVDSHIYEVRDLAWNVFPWPCIGEFWFIIFGLSRHPLYPKLIEVLTSKSDPTPKLLDLGTCVGQDLRALHHDGVPVSALYGSDVFPGYEAVGHALFKDEDKFTPDHFIAGDVFSVEGPTSSLGKTAGTWTVVNVFMFLHLLDLAQADIACEKIFKLLRPQSGSMVIGADTGNTEAGELVLRPPMCEPGEHRTIYRHSQETMKEMWERVAAKLGLKVKVTSEYDKYEMEEREKGLRESKNWEEENRFFAGSTERRVFFSVELL